MKIDIHKEVEIESTIRTELLSSMFEVPAKTKLSVTLTGDIPDDERMRNYNIGLIVGPSGSGKTLILNSIFGCPSIFGWNRHSVIDDFPSSLSMEDISRVCQSVGFNTVPSWLRPFSVLSNGERFRVETARHLLDTRNPITIDEFTSVVDRQVAQFACHAIQKYVRESKKKLVVASCHYDIIPWLQPDWILEPGNPCRFTWRSLCQRPPISCKVQRVKYETWELFREFHYMTQELNKAARCYGLYVATAQLDKRLAAESNNRQLRSHTNGSLDNSGDGGRTRIPSTECMHERNFDSDLVLQSNDNDLQSRRRKEAESNSISNNSDAAGSTVRTSTAATENKTVSTDVSRNLGESVRHSGETHRIASMCGVLYRPHPRVSDIYGFTRMVTLPDFQGLGLAFVLACKVASAYKALGKRLHSYPNHPAWIRSYQRSNDWMQVKESGSFSPRRGVSSTVGGFGGRRCAVFQYIGDAMNREDAERLINVD